MTQPAQKGFALWFTGLPCSGKSTLSEKIETELRKLVPFVEHLDGDVIRRGLSRDLGFSKEDRDANIERVAFVGSLLVKNGAATLVSFVSPYRKMRAYARQLITPFIEIYVRCPVEVCRKRDVKGMYKLADEGKLPFFTGVSDPYEEPLSPEIIVDTDKDPIEACVGRILDYLNDKHFIVLNPFPGNEILTKAFFLALRSHSGQLRKGGLPYITHPVAVARMVRETGFSDEVAAAALLHDVLEDSGCEREELERKISPAVADLVCQVSDKDKTAAWPERKANYIRQLGSASENALAIACADKTHNIESMVDGLTSGGDQFSSSFAQKIPEKVSNYRQIYDVISKKSPRLTLLSRYRTALDRLERFAR